MEFEGEFIKPFGPTVLEADCPDFIIDAVNDHIDEVLKDDGLRKKHGNFFDGEFKNLLGRDIENIFLHFDFMDEVGLTDYLEYLGNEYFSELVDDGAYRSLTRDIDKRDIVMKIQDNESEEGNECADVWVNIYGEHDFTPCHAHGGLISGVLVLEHPKEIDEYDDIHPFGKFNFMHGENAQYQSYEYFPEMYRGKTLLFPNSLPHTYYPHRIPGKTRRTLSFNLINVYE
jgi:hypothetical protein